MRVLFCTWSLPASPPRRRRRAPPSRTPVRSPVADDACSGSVTSSPVRLLRRSRACTLSSPTSSKSPSPSSKSASSFSSSASSSATSSSSRTILSSMTLCPMSVAAVSSAGSSSLALAMPAALPIPAARFWRSYTGSSPSARSSSPRMRGALRFRDPLRFRRPSANPSSNSFSGPCPSSSSSSASACSSSSASRSARFLRIFSSASSRRFLVRRARSSCVSIAPFPLRLSMTPRSWLSRKASAVLFCASSNSCRRSATEETEIGSYIADALRVFWRKLTSRRRSSSASMSRSVMLSFDSSLMSSMRSSTWCW
mmetsp:Transcript_24624/g.80487  ORF Transcript_24624/g.80487 Transcript_24624/m.80487 type:complete len:312 (-) Transcript_24624:236-1171(-)